MFQIKNIDALLLHNFKSKMCYHPPSDISLTTLNLLKHLTLMNGVLSHLTQRNSVLSATYHQISPYCLLHILPFTSLVTLLFQLNKLNGKEFKL